MTTTEIPTPVEALARTVRLDAYRESLTPSDVPLDTHIAFLRFLANAKPEELDADGDRGWALARIQTELQLISSTLQSRFDAVTRSAPPSALTEVVRDASDCCIAPTCDELLPPWEGSTCDTPECKTEAARAFGDC